MGGRGPRRRSLNWFRQASSGKRDGSQTFRLSYSTGGATLIRSKRYRRRLYDPYVTEHYDERAMSLGSMSTAQPDISISDALAGIPGTFRGRVIKTYDGLKTAFIDSNFDACGLRAGRLSEVVLRWAQNELTGSYTPFGSRLGNFKVECDKLERTARSAGPESVRVLIPRALSFLYTLRNKRGIGHEGGDVDANEIDAATAVRVADWCVCEMIRLNYTISLEEAQAVCDAIAERRLPQVWSVFGKKRVLNPKLSYTQQTLLLLYSNPETAIPVEDLISWTEHSNPSIYRRDVLRRLHRERKIEFDAEMQMVVILPPGVAKVEDELLEL